MKRILVLFACTATMAIAANPPSTINVWCVGDSRFSPDNIKERIRDGFDNSKTSSSASSGKFKNCTVRFVGTQNVATIPHDAHSGHTTANYLDKCKWWEVTGYLTTVHSAGYTTANDGETKARILWLLDCLSGKFDNLITAYANKYNSAFLKVADYFGPDKVPDIVLLYVGTSDMTYIFRDNMPPEISVTNDGNNRVYPLPHLTAQNSYCLSGMIGNWLYENGYRLSANYTESWQRRCYIINVTPGAGDLNNAYNTGVKECRTYLKSMLNSYQRWGWSSGINYWIAPYSPITRYEQTAHSNIRTYGIDAFGILAYYNNVYHYEVLIPDGIHLSAPGNILLGQHIGYVLAHTDDANVGYSAAPANALYNYWYDRFTPYTNTGNMQME